METLTDHEVLRLLVAARYREMTEQEDAALRAWHDAPCEGGK